MMPKIKICGVRRAFDAQLAVDLGATHIGCVLAKDSPRCATPGEIREIVSAVASSARMILVFRDPRDEEVAEASAMTGVENVQVHGVDESFCSRPKPAP